MIQENQSATKNKHTTHLQSQGPWILQFHANQLSRTRASQGLSRTVKGPRPLTRKRHVGKGILGTAAALLFLVVAAPQQVAEKVAHLDGLLCLFYCVWSYGCRPSY